MLFSWWFIYSTILGIFGVIVPFMMHLNLSKDFVRKGVSTLKEKLVLRLLGIRYINLKKIINEFFLDFLFIKMMIWIFQF